MNFIDRLNLLNNYGSTQSVYPSVCLSVSICLYLSVSVFLVSVSVCLCACVCLGVLLSMSVHLSVYMCVSQVDKLL